MSSLAPACIQPNPDIAGIGVRASIYAQNLLSFVPAIMFAIDGEVTTMEYKVIGKIPASILITACALLLSAFIQAATFGLSVYHANIVLNLSWINNTNFITYSVLYPPQKRIPFVPQPFGVVSGGLKTQSYPNRNPHRLSPLLLHGKSWDVGLEQD
jgi:hypothetical protein